MSDLFSFFQVHAQAANAGKHNGIQLPHSIRPLVPSEHDNVKVELYPPCQSSWSLAEKAYAFNLNRSILSHS